MRKVVAYELMSLDGVAEDRTAFITDWDEELQANLGSRHRRPGCRTAGTPHVGRLSCVLAEERRSSPS